MGNGNIVFFGTSQICIPFLKLLKDNFEIKLIITQPDATGGRHRKKIIPEVKSFAMENSIEFLQPERLKDESLVEKIRELNPSIGVVVAYGKLIPGRIFRIPEHNTINVHFSLLPLYRGAAPVQRALENGETRTGITIFEIEKKMDTGDVWAKKEYRISDSDTTGSLWETLSELGAPFLIDTIEKILAGKIKKSPQNHEDATYANQVLKSEGEVNWNSNARTIFNKLRAFTPWPSLFFYIDNRLIKIKKINPTDFTHTRAPGDVLELNQKGIKVCCGENSVLEILEIQPEGKKVMTPYSFSLGNRIPDSLISNKKP